MTFWLFAFSLALAQDPAASSDGSGRDVEEESEEEEGEYLDRYAQSEEILIVGDSAVQKARHEITRSLAEQGYVPKRQRDGVTVYLHPVPYKPKVLVYDDGFVVLRRRGFAYTPPNVGNVPRGMEIGLRTTLCILAPIYCFHAPGLLLSPARLEQQKELVVENVKDEVRAYSDALASRALGDRMAEVADLLDAIWLRGQQTDTGEVLRSPAERRSALLLFWASRADNDYGDAVRVLVEDYMNYEVQVSPFPFTEAEVAEPNRTRHCKRELVLLPPG